MQPSPPVVVERPPIPAAVIRHPETVDSRSVNYTPGQRLVREADPRARISGGGMKMLMFNSGCSYNWARLSVRDSGGPRVMHPR
jgi:hypothetical protein